MADKNVWQTLDTTNIANIGGQRFYHHPRLGKCYARVIGIPGKRTDVVRDANENVIGGGQIVELVRIYPNDGGDPYNAEVVLSDDRKVNTVSLANDGDQTDAPNTAQQRTQEHIDASNANQGTQQPVHVPGTRPEAPQPTPAAPPIETKAERKARERRERGE
jgi:hypothetical protein